MQKAQRHGSNSSFGQNVKSIWFLSGFAIGITALSLSFGSVDHNSESLSEIKVPHQESPNFDLEITKLSNQEAMYKERLPLSISRPAERIEKTPYQRSSKSSLNGAAGPKKMKTSSHSRFSKFKSDKLASSDKKKWKATRKSKERQALRKKVASR
jgi:hypothetical protein